MVHRDQRAQGLRREQKFAPDCPEVLAPEVAEALRCNFQLISQLVRKRRRLGPEIWEQCAPESAQTGAKSGTVLSARKRHQFWCQNLDQGAPGMVTFLDPSYTSLRFPPSKLELPRSDLSAGIWHQNLCRFLVRSGEETAKIEVTKWHWRAGDQRSDLGPRDGHTGLE